MFALVLVPLAGTAAVLALLLPKRRKALIWGPEPIINNKYWSLALREAGWESYTLVQGFFESINKREDFDLLWDDLIPSWVRLRVLRRVLGPPLALMHIMRNAAVVHIPFTGGPLGRIPGLRRLEAHLYRAAGIRIVAIPYGGDVYVYSRVADPSLRNALLLSYPHAAREESAIERRIRYWTRFADVVITGQMGPEMFGRWDVTVVQPICIDTRQWTAKSEYSLNDGRNGPVRVLHAPNHRGFKGTEFLVSAAKELQAEGLQVDLVLSERVPNEKVRALMSDCDILADQFIASAYGLNAVEAMASGLPVLSNLDFELNTRLFRRYSYLSECPIISTPAETLRAHLRALVTNPQLRICLGRAGRAFAEKYHSYDTAQYLFTSVYRTLLQDERIDLMNLFHPLTSDFNRRLPRVEHPLVDSRLPPVYLQESPD